MRFEQLVEQIEKLPCATQMALVVIALVVILLLTFCPWREQVLSHSWWHLRCLLLVSRVTDL